MWLLFISESLYCLWFCYK